MVVLTVDALVRRRENGQPRAGKLGHGSQSRLRGIESEAGEIEDQNNGQGAVREKADKSREEEQSSIAGQTFKRTGVYCAGKHGCTGARLAYSFDSHTQEIFR